MSMFMFDDKTAVCTRCWVSLPRESWPWHVCNTIRVTQGAALRQVISMHDVESTLREQHRDFFKQHGNPFDEPRPDGCS